MLLDDALRALRLVESYEGALIDVGSGGGSPGIPLASALPDREVTLLDAEQRKCEFLRRWAPPNARVVQGRAEEQAVDEYDVAVAKALAPPPVAAQLLGREGNGQHRAVRQAAQEIAVLRGAGDLEAAGPGAVEAAANFDPRARLQVRLGHIPLGLSRHRV